jgi:uncharacterized protein (TIRG00374 family)
MAKKKSFWYGITHQTKLDKKSYLKLVRRISLFVGIGFAASLAVFFGIAIFGGFQNVLGTITHAKLYIYIFAFLSVLGSLILRFVKWNYFLKVMGLKVPLKKNLAVYFSLYAMNITPGNVGRVVAAYTLNRITKIRFINIVPIVTMDIFTDFIGFAVLAILAAIYFHKYITYIAILDIVLLLPFLFILNGWLYSFLKKLLRKSSFIKNFTPYGEEYFASQSKLNTPKVYAVSLFVTLPAAFLSSMTLFFSLLALGVIPSLSGSVFVYSSSTIFGMASAVPGSIGVTDGALVALIGSVFHLDASLASAVTIMSRLADLWFSVILGGIFFFYTLRYWNPANNSPKKTRKR